VIERLFASATLYSTLAMFFDFPRDALHPRLIARAIGQDGRGCLSDVLLEEMEMDGTGE
jgi:hypothetical protein